MYGCLKVVLKLSYTRTKKWLHFGYIFFKKGSKWLHFGYIFQESQKMKRLKKALFYRLFMYFTYINIYLVPTIGIVPKNSKMLILKAFRSVL